MTPFEKTSPSHCALSHLTLFFGDSVALGMKSSTIVIKKNLRLIVQQSGMAFSRANNTWGFLLVLLIPIALKEQRLFPFTQYVLSTLSCWKILFILYIAARMSLWQKSSLNSSSKINQIFPCHCPHFYWDICHTAIITSRYSKRWQIQWVNKWINGFYVSECIHFKRKSYCF